MSGQSYSPTVGLTELASLLAVMRQVTQQLAYADEQIAAVAHADERVKRLQSVPSIGPVTAAAYVAALDDAGRFPRAPQVEAYLGLVPREWSSGEGQRRGRITKAGHRRVRWLLVQAAVSMLRVRHPDTAALRAWALRSRRAGAGSSPSSRWPAAWPGSFTPCSAIAPGMTPPGSDSGPPRRRPRRSPRLGVSARP
jgi:transposase